MSKDSLNRLSAGQESPRTVKPSDFPNKQSGKQGEMAGEKDSLVKLSKNQQGPRLNEGNGGAADSMSDKASNVSKTFSVSKDGSRGTTPMIPESVDLASGQINVKGYKKTRKDETADKGVTLG